MDDKVRENRLRRQANRQGMRLVKSRRRDENALDFQLYALIEHGGGLVHSDGPISIHTLDLDDVERMLS